MFIGHSTLIVVCSRVTHVGLKAAPIISAHEEASRGGAPVWYSPYPASYLSEMNHTIMDFHYYIKKKRKIVFSGTAIQNYNGVLTKISTNLEIRFDLKIS